MLDNNDNVNVKTKDLHSIDEDLVPVAIYGQVLVHAVTDNVDPVFVNGDAAS